MQTTGYFIPRLVATKLTARMKDGEDGLKRRDTCLLHDIDRNTATVVNNTNVIVRKKGYLDAIGEAAHRFISRVVENFPNQVMETIRTSGTDIHTRALAHRFKSLKDRNGRRVVALSLSFFFCCSHAE